MFRNIRLFYEGLRFLIDPAQAVYAAPGGSGKQLRFKIITKMAIQGFVTAVVLSGNMYILLSRSYSPEVEKLAAGFLGTIVGYWLS